MEILEIAREMLGKDSDCGVSVGQAKSLAQEVIRLSELEKGWKELRFTDWLTMLSYQKELIKAQSKAIESAEKIIDAFAWTTDEKWSAECNDWLSQYAKDVDGGGEK